MSEVTVQIIKDFQGESPGQRALFQVLADLNSSAVTYAHPAIFTVEEGLAIDLPSRIPGQHGKSLLLCAEPDSSLWLVVAREDMRVDLKALARQVGVKRFSFAKPEVMLEVLGVTPGSATPFALMHDRARRLRVIIDDRFLNGKDAVFHPLDNRYSTVIGVQDLLGFIRHVHQEPMILTLENRHVA